jgi:hypothetical protein
MKKILFTTYCITIPIHYYPINATTPMVHNHKAPRKSKNESLLHTQAKKPHIIPSFSNIQT